MTIFLYTSSLDWTQPLLHSPEGISSFPADDPYHYRVEDLAYCAADWIGSSALLVTGITAVIRQW